MSEWYVTRDVVRSIDRVAIEEFAIPGIILMENAGRGAADCLRQAGITGRILICCGKGNNGGDGFVIARHLETRGYDVRVLLFADPVALRGDAAVNYRILERAETPIRVIPNPVIPGELDKEFTTAEWIVDALLGTGTAGELREPFATIIDRINAAAARVMAVDLPSGLDCDTGRPLGGSVRAEFTVTFVAKKIGFASPSAAVWTGRVLVAEIGVPKHLLDQFVHVSSEG